jgi:adenylate cyclase
VVAGLDDLLLRRVGCFKLEGKSSPLSVFEVMGLKQGAEWEELGLCRPFAAAMDAFGRAQWTTAARAFEKILRDFPADGPARFYLARCRHYSARPPTEDEPWIIRMETK